MFPVPWEINNKEEIFPLATTASFSNAQRSCRECQGLVCSQLPLKHLSSLPLFLIRAPSWVFLLSPSGAALVCDKSESTPQVTNQHSQGKKNREVRTTTGWKGREAHRTQGERPRWRNKCVKVDGDTNVRIYFKISNTNFSHLRDYSIILIQWYKIINLFNELPFVSSS